MGEYIDKDDLYQYLDNEVEWDTNQDRLAATEVVFDFQAADVAPGKHGRWELHGNDDDLGSSYFCSSCHSSFDEDWFYANGEFTPFNYCPNCGAKMDGEEESE